MDSTATSFPVELSDGPSTLQGHASRTFHTITGLCSSSSRLIVISLRSMLFILTVFSHWKNSLSARKIPLFNVMFEYCGIPAILVTWYSRALPSR